MPRPVLDITVGDQLYPGMPWAVDIYEQEFGIDAAVITVPNHQASPVFWAQGRPVQITYGRSRAQMATFPGYVHHLTSSPSTQGTSAKVVCIGAVAPVMRNAASRLWAPGTLGHLAVQAIADSLHLSSLTEATDLPAPGGPVNESWWRYFVRMTRSAGFTCYAAGTDLAFHTRRVNEATGTSVPHFIAYSNIAIRTSNVIYDFTLSDNDDDAENDGLHRQRRLFGVTDEGLMVRLTDTGDLESVGGISQVLPTLIKNESSTVHDYGLAASELRALQEQNRFTRRSEFQVNGVETVRQASTVVLRGVRPDLDGYWYALEVVHHLTSADYTMTISGGRDGVGDNAPADLTTIQPIIDVGTNIVTPAPLATLRQSSVSVQDLVFPTAKTQWTASSLLHRKHKPWRAAVRG